MTRRRALTALGSLALASDARPQVFGRSAPKRTSPLLCGFSGNLAKVRYPLLGDIAREIGYEGIDLTVQIGGHVDPRITNVDLVRAFESIRGAGLEVPMITTDITSLSEPTTYPVLYLTGHTQVSLFRLGLGRYHDGAEVSQTLAQVRRDISGILPIAQRCEIAAMFPNRAGYVGQSLAEAQTIVGDMDPNWIGYYFDPAEAAAAGGDWQTAFRLALPRIKAISLQDFYLDKSGGQAAVKKCPLGEGVIDWEKFFSIASAAHFTGPMSIHMEYKPANEPAAMAKDLEFVRSHVKQAWPQT